MEPNDDCNAVCDYIPDEVAFTRYLYPKVFVKQSIMLALLEHNYDETMFWTYELYFSGFEDETYDFIFKLYNDIYCYNNPKLIKFMESTRDIWYKNSLQYWLIGSIVATLCYCNYRLDKFVENYFKVHCSHIEQPPKKLVIIQYLKIKPQKVLNIWLIAVKLFVLNGLIKLLLTHIESKKSLKH